MDGAAQIDSEIKNKLFKRYGVGMSYPLEHRKGCLITKCRICSCGLLHDLVETRAEAMYSHFAEELLLQRDAAEVLAENLGWAIC